MSKLFESSVGYTKAARFLIGFYVMYNVFLVPIGIFIPRLSIVSLILSGLLTLMSGQFRLPKEYNFLLCFIGYAFLTGIIVAVDSDLVVRKTLFLIESLLAGIIIFCVVKNEADLRQLIALFTLGAIIVGVYSILKIDILYTERGRFSLSEDFNYNTLGVMLMYGVWGGIVIMNGKKITIFSIVLTIALSLLLLYSIIQTGSRKATLSTLFLMASYAFYVFIGSGGRKKGRSKLFIIPVFIGLIIFVYFRYVDMYLERSEALMNRMDQMDVDSQGRWGIILDTIRVWLENPILGVGLDNNRYHTHSGYYAHNSYAEVLACTGILGAALFYTMFWRMISYLVVQIKGIKNNIQQPMNIFFCMLILVYLFVCFTQINFYNQTHMFITYFILTFLSINLKNNENNIELVV